MGGAGLDFAAMRQADATQAQFQPLGGNQVFVSPAESCCNSINPIVHGDTIMARRSKTHDRSGDPAAQGDLFEARLPPGSSRPLPTPSESKAETNSTDLDDAALIAAIRRAGSSDCAALTDEAVRRHLDDAVPAMEELCARFAGYGRQRALPEQTAAISGLLRLGGKPAAAAIERLILQRRVEGAALAEALRAASGLRVKLPGERVAEWLMADDPDLRAAACPHAVPSPVLTPILIELLDDLHPSVKTAASLALAHQRRVEARPVLSRLTDQAPTPDIIEAAAFVGDEPMLLRLETLAKENDAFLPHVRQALEQSDHPAAKVILRRLQKADLQRIAES